MNRSQIKSDNAVQSIIIINSLEKSKKKKKKKKKKNIFEGEKFEKSRIERLKKCFSKFVQPFLNIFEY